MTDVQLEEFAARQDGVVAAGMTAASRRVHGLRSVHDGVHVTGWGEVTERQRWWAAVLTALGTVLSHASAAVLWGLRSSRHAMTTVTRQGSHGREQAAGLLVSYSSTLDGDTTRHDGVPVTTVERTVIDLWPHLSAREVARAPRGVQADGHDGSQDACGHPLAPREAGRRNLRVEVEALSELALDRCKSDAEAWAVALIADARRALPLVNVEIAGEEADLSWPEHLRIGELDGPQFHVLRDADVRKQRAWETAGYGVRRLSTDALYADPGVLLALVPGRTSVRSGLGAT